MPNSIWAEVHFLKEEEAEWSTPSRVAASMTSGRFAIVMVSKADGKPVTERGRFTDVSRKVNGHWSYAVDHALDDPASAAH